MSRARDIANLQSGAVAFSSTISLTDSDVAHGMTGLLPTATYGQLATESGTEGGVRITTATEGATAYSVTATSTTPSTDGDGAVFRFRASKKSGTSEQALADTDDLMTIGNVGVEKVFIQGSGNVGINASPISYANAQATLFLQDDANPAIGISDTGQSKDYFIVANGSRLGIVYGDGSNTGGASNVTEIASFNNSGNVGIGTDSPSHTLDLNASSTATLRFQTSSNQRMKITNTSSASAIYSHNGNPLIFGTDSSTSDTERMRIHSSGSLTLGSTTPGIGDTAGTELTISDSTEAGITIRSGTSNHGNIYFSDATSGTAEYVGIIRYNHGSNYMMFQTNGSERMRIDSSGNVGIGSSAPTDFAADADNLVVSGSGATGITIDGTSTTSSNIYFADGPTGAEAYRGYFIYDHPNDNLRIGVSANDRMLLFGNGTIRNGYSGSAHGVIDISVGNSSASYIFDFIDENGIRRMVIYPDGDIQNADNSYGAFSDEKLKENISDASSQWDDIKALKIRKYSLKADKLSSANKLGVIAQELEASGMSGLVTESPDATNDNPDIDTTTKSVKYSILYMKAVKALQEAMTRIETLEAKVAKLEG